MRKKVKDTIDNEQDLPGYPVYPPDEDIYSQAIEEEEIDPELILQQEPGEKTKRSALKIIDSDKPDKGLDIPGAELDDDQEEVGNEDEENNYYSIGGDMHENLEEDQGENYQ